MTVDYITISNLIIDDIVFPDGQTTMNVLGGAGLHALVGMRVWSDSLGYAASVGHDVAPSHLQDLQEFGVNTEGLVFREDYETARAWQVFETNGYRTEIFRTSHDEFAEKKVQLADLPASYLAAKGYHLQWGTLSEFSLLIDQILAQNPAGKLVMEVVPDNEPVAVESWREIMPKLALFAPDQEEAADITGEKDALQNCRTFIDWGAPLVAMRMGAAGSLLMEGTGRCWQLPAVPTTIVDVTGAGNSYCGGFTVGLGEGMEPLEAALRGVVSASFALEQISTPKWDDSIGSEALRRLNWARQQVKPL